VELEEAGSRRARENNLASREALELGGAPRDLGEPAVSERFDALDRRPISASRTQTSRSAIGRQATSP
jgi:hypothetical protein